MRRAAAAFAFVFVASLVLAAYGHCWPMLAAQMEQVASATHDHGGHHTQHHHPTEGFGQELSVPGLASGPVAVVHAPIEKSFAPILLVLAVDHEASVVGEAGPYHRARAGPPAFEEFHARTGRLLI